MVLVTTPDQARLRRRPAPDAPALDDRGITLVRADNPGPKTLEGTNTWLLAAPARRPRHVVAPAATVRGVALLSFEDLTVGPVGEFGPYVVSEEEIVEFGRRWDPQRMHVDREAAEATIFGGLIASGWHTGAITMRLAVDGWLGGLDVIGGTSSDGIEMRRPVRPGDALRVTLAVLGLDPATPPRRGGAVHWSFELQNQDDEVVYRGATTMLVAGRRD